MGATVLGAKTLVRAYVSPVKEMAGPVRADVNGEAADLSHSRYAHLLAARPIADWPGEQNDDRVEQADQ